jgi:hypothetical protein
MGGLELLAEARAAGLQVKAEGDRLVIRGPKRAEPLAKELRQHKAEILAHLCHRAEPVRLPGYAASACVCPGPIGPTGDARYSVCQLPLICPGCGRCRGCKLILKFPLGRGPYG